MQDEESKYYYFTRRVRFGTTGSYYKIKVSTILILSAPLSQNLLHASLKLSEYIILYGLYLSLPNVCKTVPVYLNDLVYILSTYVDGLTFQSL